MDREKKKRIKRIVALVCIGAVVILLAAMPLLAEKRKQNEGPEASILSGTIEKGSVNTEVIGGGTISAQDPVSISVPTEVKLVEYLVSNGDSVKEGDPIATVDRVTVMTAISSVQETLDHLAEEIEAAGEEQTESDVIALAGGTVKVLYAEEDKAVQDIMLEHGALAVLSLDGLMAVDLTVESDLEVGTGVQVTLADDSTAEGKIVANLMGKLTVTMEDDSYEVGETVQVVTEDGKAIGSGELYIYSPWNATAYAGVVEDINISEGDKVREGKVLMELTDAGESATYKQLVSQRQAYEELMMDLFEMYQTEAVASPCDGVVSGVDKDSVQLLASGKESYSIAFLTNAPNGDDETTYTNYIGTVTAIGQNGWGLSVNPQNVEIADYKNLAEVPLDTAAMTEVLVYNPVQEEGAMTPVYELQGDEWVQLEQANISVGDVLLFAGDAEGNFVWMVRVQKATAEPNVPSEPEENVKPDATEKPDETVQPDAIEKPGETVQPDTSEKPGETVQPDNMTEQGTPSIPNGTYPTGGNTWGDMSGSPQGGMVEAEPEFELYDMEVVEVAAVTPQNEVKLDVTINELDVNSIKIGMSAEVKINALGGEKITATVTDISNTGTNNGGYSYFTVELSMERGENVLIGMNATATMVTATAGNVLTIPANALVEEGTKTVIYTAYDEESQTLLNPVTVQVGVSDGQNVEIVEGLNEGDTYYYAYYDTVEISFTPDFGGGFNAFSFGR